MIINLGSKNKSKIESLKEILEYYPMFRNFKVIPLDAVSGVSNHPITLEKTIEGAMNRAKNSFKNCNYSVGIESGLLPLAFTTTGYLDVCICSFYDGKNHKIGISSGYEYPIEITKLILNGTEASEAARIIGLTDKQKIGEEEGIISLLTKGRINRKDYTKEAIRNVLIQLENPELY